MASFHETFGNVFQIPSFFGNKNHLGPAANPDVKRQEACMATHHLHDKGSFVGEGVHEGNVEAIAQKLRDLTPLEYRVVVLGHIQRGGSPTARDRNLATRLGAYVVTCLQQGQTGCMVGVNRGGELTTVSIQDACHQKKTFDTETYNLVEQLAV